MIKTPNLSVEDIENLAKEDFFSYIKKEFFKEYRGARNHHYLLTYGRYLLGLARKPSTHPKNQKQKEIREKLYELARTHGVTLRNYPDLL